MSRVFDYLARFAVIVFGFLCAAIAASFFANLLIIGTFGWTDTAPFAFSGPIYFTVFFLAAFFAWHAFFPAMAAILLAEILQRRDGLTHTLAGGGVSLAAVAFAAPDLFFDTGLTAALLACGLVGGFVYWMVAGRTSGEWLDRQPVN
ncbi:hypothetical protein FY036_13815 [Mesorhizobium microcysteis]|uniref:Uncharacterized protein n=1 Tax=Neoaquamicrobium microcysteis TaxID=2682781 RepID=A0A5D4GSP0_9HYPH|nr:hypothetical protein [Mesorhizobium microcysteis]TYR31357.1 hypothetical protein FY036_13815 [Mesorhizobium microcysteis]